MSDGGKRGSRKSTSPQLDTERQAYDTLINALTQWTAAAEVALNDVHNAVTDLRRFNGTRARVACAAALLIIDAYYDFCRERNIIANVSGGALNPPAANSPKPLFPLV